MAGRVCVAVIISSLSFSYLSYAEPQLKPGPLSVALTFDDGPDARHTPAILDILAYYNIHATFFVVGKMAKAHPEIVRAIKQRGHAVANHSYSHPYFTRLSKDGVVSQISKTNAIVQAITGEAPKCWRPPYGKVNSRIRAIVKEQGLLTVTWDIETRDYTGISPARLTSNLLDHVHGGQVILMHDLGRGGDRTRKALPAIIEGLQKRHIGFEKICE